MQTSQHTLVSVRQLSKYFGKETALDAINLTIHANEVVALLGENGAGKTTTISTLLGQLRPDVGEVLVFNHKPGHWAAKQQMGVMLQSAALPDNVTVIEQLRLFASYYPNSLPLDYVLKTALLTDLTNRKVQTLSGGQKQRLLFAMAIIGNPRLVILDEPTVGLDATARREFWTCIRTLAANGTSVLLTTHYLEEADALSDRIVVLSKGRVVAEGIPADIKARLGGKCIRFRSTHAIANIESLLPDVQVQRRGDYIELISATPEAHLYALLASGGNVQDLTVTGISLEDAFLHLTQTPHTNIQTIQEKSA
ncbi:ABC transporter ATP-binding protein [Aestuariibacter sp. GS-14]|uniref:ABC transporter ATP-binding protein n=1 Tax=Aestuariibacter sp. GS-14 TaxID=2590670 RepID=UPI0011276E7D|nr:ABC transporter ATP-binding protein [Aestuariibacter sp. GS-14]TPV53927.1 ABC transporter ATP-binding protein [Aestuariibacter sp. GS-14]